MAAFEDFSQNLLYLAAEKRIPLRRVCDWLTLTYTDGNDEVAIFNESGVFGEPAPDAEALLKRFMEIDQQRGRVIKGFRHYMMEQGFCLERTPAGIWRCGTPDYWQYFYMDYRLSRSLHQHDATTVLIQLIDRLDGPSPSRQLLEELMARRSLPSSEHSFPDEETPGPSPDDEPGGAFLTRMGSHIPLFSGLVEGISIMAHDLAHFFHGDSSPPCLEFQLLPVRSEQRALFDQKAAGIIKCFKAEALSSFETNPGWSVVWRQQCQDGYWFKARFDRWTDSAWWIALAKIELSREKDADTLSAFEVLLSLGETGFRERACDELNFWRAIGGEEDGCCDCLASYLYPKDATARAVLERNDEPSLSQERALVRARHFPTLRRLAMDFEDQWAACKKGNGNLLDAWLLEQTNFRRMGPAWASALVGEESLRDFHDSCCRLASTLDGARLCRVCHHLVFWAADFYWPDVLTHLRANDAFPQCLVGLGKNELSQLVLAWTLIRPDSFAIRLAATLMGSTQPLHQLAAAAAWQRCRLLPAVLLESGEEQPCN